VVSGILKKSLRNAYNIAELYKQELFGSRIEGPCSPVDGETGNLRNLGRFADRSAFSGPVPGDK
jgi:hypothetical protein